MIDDIFHAKINFELPTSAATIGMYWREIAAPATLRSERRLAQALATHLYPLLLDCLADDCSLGEISVRQVDPDPSPNYRLTPPGSRIGNRASPALPAHSSMLLSFRQGVFGGKHHGRAFVPGVGESDTDIGQLTVAFHNGPANAVASLLMSPIQDTPDPGTWVLGVINNDVLRALPSPPHWLAAFADVTHVQVHPRLAIRSKARETRVDGRSA